MGLGCVRPPPRGATWAYEKSYGERTQNLHVKWARVWICASPFGGRNPMRNAQLCDIDGQDHGRLVRSPFDRNRFRIMVSLPSGGEIMYGTWDYASKEQAREFWCAGVGSGMVGELVKDVEAEIAARTVEDLRRCTQICPYMGGFCNWWDIEYRSCVNANTPCVGGCAYNQQ